MPLSLLPDEAEPQETDVLAAVPEDDLEQPQHDDSSSSDDGEDYWDHEEQDDYDDLSSYEEEEEEEDDTFDDVELGWNEPLTLRILHNMKTTTSGGGASPRPDQVQVQISSEPSATTVADLKQVVLKTLLLEHEGSGESETGSENQNDSSLEKDPLLHSSNSPSPPSNNHQDFYYYVRLVRQGRLLTPDTADLSTFGLKNHDCLHAIVVMVQRQQKESSSSDNKTRTKKKQTSSAATATTTSLGPQALLQHSGSSTTPPPRSSSSSSPSRTPRRAATTRTALAPVAEGAGVTADGWAVRSRSVEEEDEDEQDHHDRPLLGFDRLRLTVGLQRSQVRALRSYFLPQVQTWVRQHPAQAQAALQEFAARQQQQQQEEQPAELQALLERLVPTSDADDDDQNDGNEDEDTNHALEQQVQLLRQGIYEDAWMRRQGSTSEFRLNLAGAGISSLDSDPLEGSSLVWPIMAASNDTTAAALWRRNGNNNAATAPTARGGASTRNSARGAGTTAGATAATAAARLASTVLVGTDRDFVWGLLLGFFVGFLMLVWVWMPTVPHKQKIGILAGISFQLVLSMMIQAPPLEKETADHQGGNNNMVMVQNVAGDDTWME